MKNSCFQTRMRLLELLSNNNYYTVKDLERELGVANKTIYRFFEDLMNTGFAVYNVPGTHYYKAGKIPDTLIDFDKLVFFTQEEAYIVNSLLDSLSPTTWIKATLKRKLAAIYDCTGMVEYTSNIDEMSTMRALSEALRKKLQVKLVDYEHMGGRKKNYLIEPFAFTPNAIDVWAFDILDQRVKLFKIARIHKLESMGSRWEFEEHHRKRGMDLFRMCGKNATKVTLLMSPFAKNLLLEEYPMADSAVKQIGDKWQLTTEIYDFAGICRFYVGLADQITIVDSPEFVEYVRAFRRKYLDIL